MKKLFSALVICFAMVSTAHAGAISGELQLMGTGTYVGGTDYSSATGVNISTFGLDDKAIVTRATGGFSDVVTPGSFINMYDITFGALGDVWEVGTLKFTLHSITGIGSEVIAGIGKITDSAVGGYEDVTAFFDLKFSGGGAAFTFASSTSVPEPGTILLMGLGLLFVVGGSLLKVNKPNKFASYTAV